MIELFYRYKLTNNPWQGFQIVVQTMCWEAAEKGLSDAELCEIENDIREIREMLDEV